MAGQDGGFREAVGRFSAAVDAAVTRARRAAAEAKAQTAEFRAGTQDLVATTRQGRARPRREDDELVLDPFGAEQTASFHHAGDPAGDDRYGPEPGAGHPSDDDEYFSQHRILLRGSDEPYRPAEG